MKVPRVRDRLRGQEVLLQTYERLQQPRALDTGLLHKGLGGLATREYARCAEAVPEAFGLSASTVSRRFKRASARKLQEVSERRLDGYDLVALILDEKTFAEDEMVAAVGVAVTGEKVLLRIHSCARGGPYGQSRPLAQQRAEAPLAGDGASRSRTAAAAHQELSGTAAVA